MESVKTMKYVERIKAIEGNIAKLQRSEDVDEAMALYEDGMAHIKACEEKIAAATKKFAELQDNQDNQN